MVRAAGFEPATTRIRTEYSTRLSYALMNIQSYKTTLFVNIYFHTQQPLNLLNKKVLRNKKGAWWAPFSSCLKTLLQSSIPDSRRTRIPLLGSRVGRTGNGREVKEFMW